MIYTLGMRRALRAARKKEISPYLDGILPSSVFDLDITQSGSYPGTGQYWKNLITKPADGVTQSAYDFILGVSAENTLSDPAYTESGIAAYWHFNGAQWHTLNGPQTNFLKKLHRSDNLTPFWVAICWKTPPSYAGNDRIFGSAVLVEDYGIQMQCEGDGGISFLFNGGAGNNYIFTGAILPNSQDSIMIFSYNPAAGMYRAWINSRTAQQGTVDSRSKCNG